MPVCGRIWQDFAAVGRRESVGAGTRMKEVPEVPRKESTLQLSNYQFQGNIGRDITAPAL